MSLRFGPTAQQAGLDPVFGNRNNRIMTLKSALDDVLKTTLAAVSGIIGKLEYIAGLRDEIRNTSTWECKGCMGRKQLSKRWQKHNVYSSLNTCARLCGSSKRV